jgi:transcriptional regulator with PAS, ATPase and Fis domain
MANGGTLFLDEIGDLSLPVQAKLLRVLETRSLRRIGGSREIAVKVRIIAATNTPLETLVKEGTFRRDLLYRLNIFPIHIQPLRTRKEDIPPVAEHFLTLYSKRSGKKVFGIKPEAMKLLLHYDYPGNVRELQNILERAAIICRDDAIDTKHIIFQPAAAASQGDDGPKAQSSDDERTVIIKALENTHWNRRKAATLLGIPYSTLRYKMTVLGIS